MFAPNKCHNRYNYLCKKLLDATTDDPDVAVVDEPEILNLETGIDTLSLLK